MRYFSLLILITVAHVSIAQNDNLNYKSGFKVYNHTAYEVVDLNNRITSPFPYIHTSKNIEVLRAVPAFMWQTKGNNFHEVELTRFSINKFNSKPLVAYDTSSTTKNDRGDKTFSTNLELRYEFVLNFNKNADTKFVPSLGFAFSPYFRHNKYTAESSSLYPAAEYYLGVKSFVIPRVTYYLNSKLFLDINVPICVYDAHYRESNNKNPALPFEQQVMGAYIFKPFAQIFTGRVGIGVKI
jgi:hypothetical protein